MKSHKDNPNTSGALDIFYFFFLVQHSAFIQRERREGKRAFSGLDEGTGDEGKEATVIRNLEKKRRELARIVGCG